MQTSTSNDQLLGFSGCLEKRIASYGAMALAAALGGTTDANAAIISFDGGNTQTAGGSLSFNILTGAVSSSSAGNDFAFRVGTSAYASAGGLGSGRSLMALNCECALPLKLGLGNLIGPSGNFIQGGLLGSRFSTGSTTSQTSSGSLGRVRAAGLTGNGAWQSGGVPAGRGFLGLRFLIGAVTHFGWADITVNPDFTVTLHSFAYEACAEEGISAGATTGGIDCNIVAETPEPHSAAMLAMGAAGLLAYRRRRKCLCLLRRERRAARGGGRRHRLRVRTAPLFSFRTDPPRDRGVAAVRSRVKSFIVVFVSAAFAACQRGGPLPEFKLDGQPAAVRRMLTDSLETARSQASEAGPSGQLGKLLLAHRLPEPALMAFERAHKLDPTSSVWPYYAGVIQQERKDYANARKSFEQHLALEPESFAAQVRLAEVLAASGGKTASLERYATTISLRPKSPRALFGMGLLLQSQGRHEEAGGFFQRAVASFPRYRMARIALAETWRARGDEAKAAETLYGYDPNGESAAAQPVPFDDPLMAEVRRLDAGPLATRRQAQQLAREGKVGQAVRLIEGSLKDDPHSAAFRSDLMMYFTHLKQWDKAIEQFHAMVDENPDNAGAHAQRGEMLVAQRKCEEAVESFDTALQIDASQGKAHVGLGECQLVLKRVDSAESHFRKAIEAHPGETRAHALLGILLTGKGQFGEAIPHLLRADEDAYGRERAELLFALGKAYEKTGKNTEARATLETARVLADAFGGGPVKPVAPSKKPKR